MRQPPSLPTKIPGTHFSYGLSRTQGHGGAGRTKSMKNLKDHSGIESATLRVVGQFLNQLRHRVQVSYLKVQNYNKLPVSAHFVH